MFESVPELRRSLSEVVRALEPEVLHARDAARLLEEFAAMEKLVNAALTLLAPRAADAGGWRGSERSAAHWLARTTGKSVGAAVGMLEAGEQLEKLPVAREALRSGQLSATQVSEIAAAAAVAPAAEATLVAAAAVEPVAGLRDQCRKVKAAALIDEVARYRAVHASRALRHWHDPDGAFRLDLRTTPDAGAEVLAALESRRRRLFDAARQEGRRERFDAYLADALVALARDAEASGGDTGRSGPRATVHVRVDHSAFVRGHTVDGETCEVAGVGPVPVATVRALASDAILSAVVTKGVEVTAVAHLGRTIPAHVRTALEVRDPECVVEGCHVAQHLEIDHVVPWAEHGPTALHNLARLCRWHHHLKTYDGYRLEGEPGRWRWVAPAKARAGPDPPWGDGWPHADDARGDSERGGNEDGARRRATVGDLQRALAAAVHDAVTSRAAG